VEAGGWAEKDYHDGCGCGRTPEAHRDVWLANCLI